MKPTPIESTLGGGYLGLYGEVATHDCYQLRSVQFRPDIIFDIGGNIGVFARFARTLFPKAQIISVEPDPGNCEIYRHFTQDKNTLLVPMALGKGQIYHGLTARNGSGETYLSAGLGYPRFDMDQMAFLRNSIEVSSVPAITLAEVVRLYDRPNAKAIMKIDCEGAENTIWGDPDSMKALTRMDYIAMEIHSYALTGRDLPEVIEVTNKALRSLRATHDCRRRGVHFWATKL